MIVRRHPNPITDCCHSTAGREGRTDRSERAGKGGWKPTTRGESTGRDKRGEEREETASAQEEKEKRQKETSLSFKVTGKC